jgi:hypothetical protein
MKPVHCENSPVSQQVVYEWLKGFKTVAQALDMKKEPDQQLEDKVNT